MQPGKSSSTRSPRSASSRGAYSPGVRAAVMREWELRVDDVAEPVPGPGQVLTKVLACGICGSDLHMLRHGAELRRLTIGWRTNYALHDARSFERMTTP